jgi:hypothetical protein
MKTKHLFVGKKSLTAIFVFFFSIFGIQSSYADYYPSGIQQNVSEETLRLNGWTLRYEQTYSTVNSSTGSEFRPSESFIIVAGKSIGSNVLTTVAAAPTAQVFTETVLNTPQLLNGTYWYYTPGSSIGYSPTNVISQSPADNTGCDGSISPLTNACASAPSRLSWHLDGSSGGYRLGNAGWLNSNGDGGNLYLKQVWSWNGISAAPAPAEVYVRKSTNLQFHEAMYGSDKLSDPDGQLRKTVDAIDAKYGNLIK